MSDEKKALEEIGIDKIEADNFEPFVDGLEKVAKFTTATKRILENRMTDIETNMKNGLSGVNEKIERGIGDTIDRVETLSKRTSVFGRMGFEQDEMSAVKSAIPDRFRKNWNAYEQAASRNGKTPTHEDVIKFAVQDVYFKDSTKLGLRAYQAQRDSIGKELFEFTSQLDKISKADLYEATAASGGATVPIIVASEILKLVRDASVVYPRARQIPMSSNVMQFPDENTAVTHNWVTEGNLMTGTEPLFGVKTLTAKKLACRAVFSQELLEDANVAIVPFLQSCFAERMGGELDYQAMEGPGTVFTGVLLAVSVSNCGRTNTTIGVPLKYNSAASTQASLAQLYTKAGEFYARDQGIFVCGPGVYAQIIGMVDTNGQPVVRLGTVEGQPNNTLFGRPIVVSNRLLAYTVGAGPNSVGTLFFGPPSALLFGVRSNMQWDVTDQVHWSNYQVDARLVGRFAFVTGVPTAWAFQKDIQI